MHVENPNPGSTEPNGIKVRVPGIKSFQLTGETLGYIPAPMPFSEAFTVVQTGVVDGVIGSGAEGYHASFRDVTKTYVPANTHFEVCYMIISNASLAELSDEDQAALKEQAAAFEATRWEVAEADQGKNEQRLVDELGAAVAELTDDELAAMAAKARAEIWPAVLEDVGVECGQAILDKIAAAGNQANVSQGGEDCPDPPFHPRNRNHGNRLHHHRRWYCRPLCRLGFARTRAYGDGSGW